MPSSFQTTHWILFCLVLKVLFEMIWSRSEYIVLCGNNGDLSFFTQPVIIIFLLFVFIGNTIKLCELMLCWCYILPWVYFCIIMPCCRLRRRWPCRLLRWSSVMWPVSLKVAPLVRNRPSFSTSWVFTLVSAVVLNSLWSSDGIWWHKSGSTLAQLMACCLMGSSHYLNQCSFIIRAFPGYSFESNFTSAHELNL